MSNVLLQNAGGNCFVTLNGPPLAGTPLWSQPYSGGPTQLFTPVEYPGTNPSAQGGVVTVFFLAGTQLVLQAGPCGEPLSLQPFSTYNLYQLWAHAPGQFTTFLNTGSGCMLDLHNSDCSGGTIQTYSANGSDAQKWAQIPAAQAAAMALAANSARAEPAGA